MSRLVVGVQGPSSLTTLVWAADHAFATGGEVVAVHVMPPVYDCCELPEVPIAACSIADDYALLLRVLERDWCDVLRVRGVTFRAEVVLGAVAPSLCAVARREHATMLVIGSPRPRLLLGGLRRLVTSAPCSVVFVEAGVPADLVDRV